MSIRMPEAMWSKSGEFTMALDIPGGATFTVANTGTVIGFFMRTLPQGAEENTPLVILSRNNAATGGNDCYLRLDNDFSRIEFQLIKSGTSIVPATTVAVPAFGDTFLFLLIATPTSTHFVTCEPGGTPTRTTIANTEMHDRLAYDNTAGDLGGQPFTRIGSAGTSSPFFGEIENLFTIDGDFPETGGVPDETLIQNIANGTQDIATLHTQLASGAQRSHYPLRIRGDYSDAFGNYGDLTLRVAENVDEGWHYYSGGPLRPGSLRPAKTGHCISPLAFADEETTVGATATIRAEGGTYHEITPAAIEARLVKEDGTAHVDWTTIDATPSGGVWTGGDFSSVPATPGYLEIHFRAVDGTGTPISDEVASKGLRGTGFADHAVVCQSQGIITLINDQGTHNSYVSGTRTIVVEVPGSVTEERMLSSSITNGRSVGAGVVYLTNEVQARFPGYPVQIGIVGQSGNPLNEWDTGGLYVGRWQQIADYYNIQPPNPTLLLFGHSDGPAARADYLLAMGNVSDLFAAQVGTLSKIGVFPTPRYAGIGSGSTYTKLRDIRAAQQDFVDNNPGVAYHYGSASGIATTASAVPEPHPAENAAGTGVTGSLLGLGMMARHGAIAAPARLGAVTVTSDTEIRVPLVPLN